MRRLTKQTESERGSVLIEVLVSAIMLVITAVGVFGAFEAGTRSTAEERHRAQAEGLAQADVTRMRTMRISDLANLRESKPATVDGSLYTVESEANFATDSTGTASCAAGTASADYIKISSIVTWPTIGSRDPVEQESLVAPPNGSISPESGSLAIQIEDAESEGVQGVGLIGTGAGTFSGVTGPNGCAVFGDLPAGNYTLTLSGPSLVDKNGEAPQPKSTSVVEESTNTLTLLYDEPGEIAVGFETRIGGELVPSEADSVVAFNSGMSVAKAFGALGTPSPEVAATPLFPFTSSYSVYAGTCEADHPSAGESSAPAVAEAFVSPGGGTPVTIELPALHLTVWSGSGSEPGEPVAAAEVKLADTECEAELEEPQVRAFTTDSQGGLPDPGLPFSTYDLCVSDGARRFTVPELAVPADPEDMAAGTTTDVYLDSPEAETGECP